VRWRLSSAKPYSTLCARRASPTRLPAEVYASLLDEGVNHGSIRTMYRILAANQEVRARGDHLRHPIYKKSRSCWLKCFVTA
jgi:hypothetical protein